MNGILHHESGIKKEDCSLHSSSSYSLRFFCGFLQKMNKPRIYTGLQLVGMTSHLHMLFDDHSFIVCHENIMESHNIKDIMDIYSKIYGQVINLYKFASILSSNMHHHHKKLVKDILGIERDITFDKYVGIMLILSRKNTNDF